MREISRHNVSRSKLWRPGELMIKRRLAGPRLPTIRVTGGIITAFTLSGVDYIEFAYSMSGSFSVSAEIPGLRYALGAGGGSTGNGFNRGGGGAGEVYVSPVLLLLPGNYTVSLGAGGNNSKGTDSVLSGPISRTVAGGGWAGSGTTTGGNGWGGGGAGGNTGVRAGGVGTSGFNGGASGGLDRSPGGGAGNAAAGQNGGATSGQGGDGGAGLDLDFTSVPRGVGGGGGGGTTAAGWGEASHGGTPGTDGVSAQDATLSGGAGGSRINSVPVARGGNGFGFFVVPAEGIEVVAA